MISNLNLKQFRSYINQSFEFENGVNIIVGPNGSGKTNLLEAIYVIATNKTFKQVTSKDLINNLNDSTKLTALDSDQLSRSVVIKNQKEQLSRKYIINQIEYNRLPYDKSLPVVLFEPNNLNVLGGSPERRRKYLDDLIDKTNPGYDKLINKYQRTLVQRNSLLKNDVVKSDDIFVWDIKLTELATLIVGYRNKLIDSLNQSINELYNEIASIKPKYDIELVYLSKWNEQDYASQMIKHLQENLKIDSLLGYTQTGPHKDDFRVNLNKKDSLLVASRGENRTLVLALKIMELKQLEEVRQQKPILLLDDVFSELDGKRRKHLTNLINNYQTFITTTDADLVINNFNDSYIVAIKSN